MKRSHVVALGAGLLFLFGCEQRLGDFTFLSSKNIDLSNLEMEADENAPIVEGEDSKPIIFVFSTGVPNLKEAVDRAIESGRGTALSDVSIYYTHWYIPYIVGENKFRVRGKVVR
ncbi:MAG: hypothetical protein KAY37_09235 [Phycisphaerae bacterium]|nr:hypothetical protein [Phycisphaerae bacterium]